MKNNFYVVLLASLFAVLVGCQNAQGQQGENEKALSGAKAKTVSATQKTQLAQVNPSKTKQAANDKTAGTQKMPAGKFTVRLETTKGNIDVEVDPALAPLGAARFFELVTNGYYTDVAFFRVIPGFMAQVGLSGDPAQNRVWRQKRISDDPVKGTNARGMVTFATAGPNSRTTQFFINFKNNGNLDRMGFAPFGQVTGESLSVVDSLYGGYGEGAPRGRGPAQGRIHAEGNTYLKKDFPKLDYIKRARVLK